MRHGPGWFGDDRCIPGIDLGALFAIVNVVVFRRPGIVAASFWAGFSTLTVYVIGSIGQAIGIMIGTAGDPALLDAGEVVYVLNFFLATSLFGILAISYTRRLGIKGAETTIGACGGTVILVALPWLLHLLPRALARSVTFASGGH